MNFSGPATSGFTDGLWAAISPSIDQGNDHQGIPRVSCRSIPVHEQAEGVFQFPKLLQKDLDACASAAVPSGLFGFSQYVDHCAR
ncbi:hypothetical protein [Nitrosomonas sp. JL21]|uniref:hypothetical protein n=1 Tax=Nitrosomonas sp. JL21 TaxID=153949 RepID=UPI0013DDF01B|nr:hypothetical protein [Nitrosomonas sp. JL21]